MGASCKTQAPDITVIDGCQGRLDTCINIGQPTCSHGATAVTETTCALPGGYTVIYPHSSGNETYTVSAQSCGQFKNSLFFGNSEDGICAIPYAQ